MAEQTPPAQLDPYGSATRYQERATATVGGAGVPAPQTQPAQLDLAALPPTTPPAGEGGGGSSAFTSETGFVFLDHQPVINAPAQQL